MDSCLRSLLLLVIVTCAPTSIIVGQEFRVLTVDLYGTPVSGVDVRVGNGEQILPQVPNFSDKDGIATVSFGDDPPPNRGGLQIRVNMNATNNRETLDASYIGRAKNVSWDEKDRFSEGFAVPLWTPGDVKHLAEAVITNPTHYLVAVQEPRTPGGRSRIIMKFEGDVDGWLTKWAPDLPRVESPRLARALYAALETGEQIPAQFDIPMRAVYEEVNRQNDEARVCRMQGSANQNPPVAPPPLPSTNGSSNNDPSNNGPIYNPPPPFYNPPTYAPPLPPTYASPPPPTYAPPPPPTYAPPLPPTYSCSPCKAICDFIHALCPIDQQPGQLRAPVLGLSR